jgi:hypothetical protein
MSIVSDAAAVTVILRNGVTMRTTAGLLAGVRTGGSAWLTLTLRSHGHSRTTGEAGLAWRCC